MEVIATKKYLLQEACVLVVFVGFGLSGVFPFFYSRKFQSVLNSLIDLIQEDFWGSNSLRFGERQVRLRVMLTSIGVQAGYSYLTKFNRDDKK